MRDVDEAVEKLLVCLRDATPAANLEHRIVAAMQQEANLRQRAGRRRLPWPAWRTAVAAMLSLLLVTILAGRQHRRALPGMNSHKAPASSTRQVNEKAVSVMPRKRLIIRARNPHDLVNAVRASASYPAPPLPLTEQEQLLLRLARRRDPGSLAILNPEERNAQTALNKKQFQQFFGLNEQEMRTQLE